jgi:hypothetical protein
MTTPTPPRDLSERDAHGIAGTIHECDPAAVAHLKTVMAQQQPPRWQEARRRQYNGSQIVANLQRTAERLYEARRKTLTPAELAAALSRHNAGEGWKPIAADYGMSHTTLMRRVEEEQRAAQLAKRQEQTQ